jgi:hypothetical protein
MIRTSERADYFFVMLDTCDCSVLRHLLHPEADFIWIHSHTPDPSLGWWEADVPVSPRDILEGARIRAMEYDLLIDRATFLKELDRFLPHGINLTQLTRPVPESLWIPSLPKGREEAVLIENGMKVRFYLPHAGEIAQFSATDRDHIEAVCSIPEIHDLILNPEGEKFMHVNRP